MSAKDKYYYPLSEKTLKKLAASILTPIKRKESVTTIWVPMAGRRIVTKFFIENIKLFKNILPNYQEYLLVYIEPLELTGETARGYFRLVGKSLSEACLREKACKELVTEKDIEFFKDESLSYSSVINRISALIRKITKAGFKIVFFLGEFDELEFANSVFYNNLKMLWLKFSPLVQFVFLNREDTLDEKKISQYGDLNEVLLQNIVYIPIFREETDYLISRITSRFERKFSKDEKKLIKKLCGPHPYSIIVAGRFISRFDGKKISLGEIGKQLLNHYEMNAVSRGVLDVQTEKSKRTLKKLANGYSGDDSLKSGILEKLGLIYKENSGEWKVFGEVFKKACLGKKEAPIQEERERGLAYDSKIGAILLHGKPVEEKFTTQEYNVLTIFLKEPNILKKRDDIGEVLWGEDSYEKYSDWAIDQLMSKLRKKLKKINAQKKIITLRGRGYKFVSG